jgi:hypothetical protein
VKVNQSRTTTDVASKYRIGTPADTPTSLRLKAADFLRMAGETRDLALSEELRLVSALYQERAVELEKAGSLAVMIAPETDTSGTSHAGDRSHEHHAPARKAARPRGNSRRRWRVCGRPRRQR